MIVISPAGIKLTHQGNSYDLKSMPFLGFGFSYLYYEPEANLYRKVIENTNKELVYEDLTDNEITLLQDFVDNLNNKDTLTEFLAENLKQPDYFETVIANSGTESKTPVHAVDSQGFYVGQQVLPVDGLTQVSSNPPQDLFLEPFGIAYKWNFESNTWDVNGDYRDKRRLEYLKNISIGAQLGALFNAVDALAKGKPLPADFTTIMSDIQGIKNSIKKD